MQTLKSIIPVFITIILTIYAQLIIKWQVNLAGKMPPFIVDKVYYVAKVLFNPWVISGFVAVFIGGISWMFAMTKLPLSFIYPFIGLTIVSVMVASAIIFNESVSSLQIVGIVLVVMGLVCVGVR